MVRIPVHVTRPTAQRDLKKKAVSAAKSPLTVARWVFNLRKVRPSFQPGSITGRIVFDFYNMKKADQSFKEAKNNLRKKYTLKQLSKLQGRYMRRDPQKFQEKYNEMIEGFVTDYETFLGAYVELFRMIKLITTLV